jgi:hypothetical protein
MPVLDVVRERFMTGDRELADQDPAAIYETS